ncbi:MAG: hypothetical protein OHK0013_09660 [Sandaracinaceae bacterium]
MDYETLETVHTVLRLTGGFFDFLTFVGLLVVALMFVRKADGTLGYVLAGAASLQFLTTCCTNVVTGLSAQIGEAAGMIGAALSGVGLFIELGLWGVVLFVLYSLAGRAPQQG